MKNLNNLSFATVVLVVIVVAALAIGGYFVMKSRTAVAPTDSPTPIASATSSPNETVSWKTLNFDGSTDFSIKYPPSWIPEETHVNNNQVASLKLTNNSYVINIGQADGGVENCIFSDDKKTDPNFDLDLRNISFVEISTPIGVLRRFPTKTIYSDFDADFSFCSKQPNSGFKTRTQIGGIIYKLPPNYNTQILLEMDKVVKTITP